MLSDPDSSAAVEIQPRGLPFFSLPADGAETNDAQSAGRAANWIPPTFLESEKTEDREQAAFERGLRQGELQARGACDAGIEEQRRRVSIALEEFISQREIYFSRIETEVVQLALAISRKILHREAQMDPLLLAGAVHVALEKIDSGTHVRLRAHPNDVQAWRIHFQQPLYKNPAPDLVGDSNLSPGELALETASGSTQIGLDLQLKEIEQGFFDLLAHRSEIK
jgi:flagellar assembly protein FliH